MTDNLTLETHTLATVVSARLDAHEKTCSERYGRIAGDMAEIKVAIQALSSDVKGAVQRIHERIDSEANGSRERMDTAVGDAKVQAMAAVAEAVDAHRAISGLKVWALTGAGSLLLAAVAWLADHFFSGGR